MSGLNDDYCAEIDTLQENCRTLRRIDPKNEHLQLIIFDKRGNALVKPEFWEEYGPKGKKIPHYTLHTLANANKQLRKAIKEAEEKDLTSKVD